MEEGRQANTSSVLEYDADYGNIPSTRTLAAAVVPLIDIHPKRTHSQNRRIWTHSAFRPGYQASIGSYPKQRRESRWEAAVPIPDHAAAAAADNDAARCAAAGGNVAAVRAQTLQPQSNLSHQYLLLFLLPSFHIFH